MANSAPGRSVGGGARLRVRTILAGALCTLLAGFVGTAGAAHAAPHSRGTSRSAGTAMPPPALTVLTRQAGGGTGDIFIAPAGGEFGAGPEILTEAGKVVWFHPLPDGEVATDFRTQTYRGKPVLTWLQSSALGSQDGPGAAAPPTTNGVGYIYNDRYQLIATVHAGNGDPINFHELLITPQNTALILADKTVTADLTAIGGPADQQVLDQVVQNVDIRTGRVLFEWDAAAHIPYTDSYQGLPASASTPWDWLHLNAVHIARDGNLLVDARNTWTVYKVNRQSGQIMWQLGGKRSSFAVDAAPGQSLDNAGEIFAWQHDPEALGNDYFTLFDDEANASLFCCSRTVTVHLDVPDHTATLVSTNNQPEGEVARVMGNAQPIPGGGLFVGWGSLPYVSEFSPSGQLRYNAELPSGVETYRAYLLPWHPASPRSRA